MTSHWLLIRGLARHSAHWGDFTSTFEAQIKPTSIEFIDLAGNGTRANEKSLLSLEQNLEDLRLRSQTLAAGKKLSLCTISMGSMIGILWAAKYPNEIERLVVINSSTKSLSPIYHRIQPKSLGSLFHILFAASSLAKEKEILKMTSSRLTSGPDHWAKQFAELLPTNKMNTLRQLYAASKFCMPKQKPNQVSCLFLGGAKDNLVHPSCSKKMAASWNSPYFEHPLAGHDLPLDDASWICEKILTLK